MQIKKKLICKPKKNKMTTIKIFFFLVFEFWNSNLIWFLLYFFWILHLPFRLWIWVAILNRTYQIVVRISEWVGLMSSDDMAPLDWWHMIWTGRRGMCAACYDWWCVDWTPKLLSACVSPKFDISVSNNVR